MRAQCSCGHLHADITGEAEVVIACHCTDCQRRSGSPFGVVAYYPAEAVTLHGTPSAYTRPTESGAGYTISFCPTCGATVWASAGQRPDLIGIPVGAIADPAYRAPDCSLWESRAHHWVAMPAAIAHSPGS